MGLHRYRLRSATHELELPVGEFLVGRTPDCDLALDDKLVSRRHAVFHVGAKGVAVEDLASKNGVLVNGARIARRTALLDGDRVTIGTHELRLVHAAQVAPQTPSTDAFAEPRNKQKDRDDDPRTATTLDPADASTTAANVHAILVAVAEKSLVRDRVDDAVRVTGSLVRSLWASLGRGEPPAPEHMRATLGFLLRLADLTGSAEWLDQLFELSAASGRLLDAATTERLHELVRTIRYHGVVPFRQYLQAMQQRSDTFGPNERFRLNRLESLGRVIESA